MFSVLLLFSELERQDFEMTMNVDQEIERLKTEIGRLGTKNDDGSITVKFGTLFHDDRCANIFEALVGTLRAAKKRKLVTFDAEMLFQGVHDNVDIVLVKPKEVVAVDAVKPTADVTTAPVELKDDKKVAVVAPVVAPLATPVVK